MDLLQAEQEMLLTVKSAQKGEASLSSLADAVERFAVVCEQKGMSTNKDVALGLKSRLGPMSVQTVCAALLNVRWTY